MKRFIEFDVLRGVLLLMMSIDHSPSSLRRFTDQPLGFFSTAECFVFVSAFLAGMLFRKRAEKLGFAAAALRQVDSEDLYQRRARASHRSCRAQYPGAAVWTFAGKVSPDRSGSQGHPGALHECLELHRSVLHRR
jgi:hypothetical protein